VTPAHVAVVGSCNLDQVLVGRRYPRAGKTVSADGFFEEPGGKGPHQALAAARIGARVSFVGAVGDDAGISVREVPRRSGVDTGRMRRTSGSTGRAFIFVDEQHDNRIVLLSGANGILTKLGREAREVIEAADAVLQQLELPQSVVLEAAETARRAGVPVALTAAPVRPLDPRLFDATSLLFVDELEALEIAECAEPDEAVTRLLGLVPAVVVTRGGLGSDYADRTALRTHRDAADVTPIDTSAAGDTYAGVFVAARTGGADVETAMGQATAAAAIVVQRRGTSTAIPTAREVLGDAAPS
jgi:ribokinase